MSSSVSNNSMVFHFELKIFEALNVEILANRHVVRRVNWSILLAMGRSRRIAKEAKPTTISLTLRQQIAFQELQVKRLKEGSPKPTLTEAMVEGFQLVLKREGVSGTELERI